MLSFTPLQFIFLELHALLAFTDTQPGTGAQTTHYHATLAQFTTATLALVLGISFPIAANYLGRWRLFLWLSEQHGIHRAIKERADPLELLLSQALHQGWKLLFTLKNGKVYAGTLKRNFNPAYALTSIEVLVECSGYRRQEDHTVVLNTHYEDLINRTKQQLLDNLLKSASDSVRENSDQDVSAVLDAAIKNIREREQLFNPETATVIPVTEIISVHPFDAQIYRSHMAINSEPAAETKADPEVAGA